MTTLGTLGSGLMATEVARLATAAGIEVRLANSRGPESLADLAAELGPLATAATPEQAAEADVVLLALPLGRLGQVDPARLADKLVLDLTNYYPHRDGRIGELDANTVTAGQFVQAHLAGSRTVRVFNNIAFHHIPQLARPAGAADRSALPLAGDDAGARAEAAALVDRLGFDTVAAGELRESWRFEPDTVAYLRPYLATVPTSPDQLPTIPGAPVAAATIRRLLDRAERTDQGARTF
jgi:predicted dinucleotide-binding enzyme